MTDNVSAPDVTRSLLDKRFSIPPDRVSFAGRAHACCAGKFKLHTDDMVERFEYDNGYTNIYFSERFTSQMLDWMLLPIVERSIEYDISENEAFDPLVLASAELSRRTLSERIATPQALDAAWELISLCEYDGAKLVRRAEQCAKKVLALDDVPENAGVFLAGRIVFSDIFLRGR